MNVKKYSSVWRIVCVVLSVVAVCLGQSDGELTPCYPDGIFDVFRTNTSPWSVLSQCDVTKAYSALQRYSCQLFMEHDDSSKTVAGPSIPMETKPIDNGDYVSGTCEMTADLSPDDGRYTYTVMISPGRLNFTAAFTGTNEIRRPSSVRMAHTCPEYVDEGSNLDCTCTATDLGSPPGSVEWDGTQSARLQRANVQRQDDRTIFRCRVLWNTASFGTGSYTLRVSRQPSTPLNHTCPKYVTEGSDLDCTCTTSDFGVPPGTTQWLESGSSRLVRSRVPREFAGTTFTCQLVWREQVVQSLTYTVSTAPSGALIQQARSEGLASGMGAGVGIGLVVALVCVLVLVIVLWRRGWRLPCAGDRGANQDVEMGPPPTSSQSRELGGGAPSAGDTEDCSGSSGMYEGLQHNQMNVPSAYEELHMGAGASNTKAKKPRVYDNCAFDPDGARGGNTPNADRPRAKKGRKKKQSVPAQDSSCTVQFRTNTSPWSVLSQCDVTKAYSALHRYSCQLFMEHDDSSKTVAGPSIHMKTKPIGNGNYVSGTCEMTADLPPDDGRYNYTVMISPGRLNVTAAFTGTNEIRRPSSVRMAHTCPEYVDEGSNLNCTCTATDPGSPPGSVEWDGTKTERLQRANVRRQDDRTIFRCRLLWNTASFGTGSYTLRVSQPPSRLTHNCPEYASEGSSVRCSCSADDVGHPAGTPRWTQTGSEYISLTNVSLVDQGKKFQCQMTWRGRVVQSIDYTLIVPRQPSTPLNHTCPKYVTEGSDLDCTCTTSDFGVPPGTTQWLESGSSRLVRSRVPREFAGTTFTCLLVWREQVVQSLTYTVSTAPSGALIQQARSEGLASGMGAGVGIGLVVALLCVLVLVVVLWRRGWKLPCAGDRGASQSVEMGPPPTSSQSRELGGGAPSAGDTEDCSGPSGIYEGLQHNQMNVPSAYEELHMSAGASNTKS
ncbi:hypothetical protein BaRGS_00003098, partial [Batillaria attramentaria]